MTLLSQLEIDLRIALQAVLGEHYRPDCAGKVTHATDLGFGDYQTNIAMVLAKRFEEKPGEFASAICRVLGQKKLYSVSVAGAGFINFRITPDGYGSQMLKLFLDKQLGAPTVSPQKKVVIDFSAPNIAKPMHVGHIRSTFIGDALARVARFLGYKVITDNHIGDWGTQFGMILWGWKNIFDKRELKKNPVAALGDLYKRVNIQCAEDEEVRASCRQELVKLQSGDEVNMGIWRECVEISKTSLQEIYKRLYIKFDFWLGESHYNPMLAPLVAELLERGIAQESEGAVCIFSDGKLPQEKDPFLVQEDGKWRANPAIVRKSGGGFLYATTDLATIDWRIRAWHADAIWYVVGVPQSLHFRQVFAAQKRRGAVCDMRHVEFGSILGEDRRPFKTRSGETVSLQDLLDEAVERSGAIIKEKNPDMSAAEVAELAEVMGLGAVKFAELSQNRMTDYVFSWDKMLAMQGDTAPYLQNSYVRVRSIFRKLEMSLCPRPATMVLNDPAELHLARILARFGEIVPVVLDDFRPNLLASYLYDLARAFHAFYEACPVIKAENPARGTRLALCDLTARTLKQGMGLLGIKMPERM